MMTQSPISQFLSSFEFLQAINEVGASFKLNDEKLAIIKDIFRQLLAKEFNPFDLTTEVQSQLQIDYDQAVEIAAKMQGIYNNLVPEDIQAFVEKNEIQAHGVTLESIIEEIKDKAQLKINKQWDKRLEDIIFNWYRDIRDDAETIEKLQRNLKVGGLEMTEYQATNFVGFLKSEEEALKQKGINILDLITQKLTADSDVLNKTKTQESEIDVAAQPSQIETKPGLVSNDVTIEHLLEEKGITYDQLANKEAIKKQILDKQKDILPPNELVEEIEEKEHFLQSQAEITAPGELPARVSEPKKEKVASPVQAPVAKSSVSPKVAEPIVSAPIKAPISAVLSEKPVVASQVIEPVSMPSGDIPSQSVPVRSEGKQPLIKRNEQVSRPKIEDVKFEQQVIGPIEELAALSVADLRRLAKNPQDAVEKINDKLDLLEDESIIKKIEGIKALKTSPLYQVYAQIMNQAMKEGKSFSDILQADPVMTDEEFKTVMAFNKSLKY